MAVGVVLVLAAGCAGDETTVPQTLEESPPVLASPTTVPLPAPENTGTAPLATVLAGRRSVRDFADGGLEDGQVAQLLWAAQGVTSPGGGRTAPSAGGLYPLEVYLVDATGVGRYRPSDHVLEHRAGSGLREALAAAALEQAHVREAPAVVVITAVVARSAAKYGDRGERYAVLEAGHAAQNVLLQAVALGLGAVPVGAFDDAAVQRVLGLPADHAPLELIPVGPPR